MDRMLAMVAQGRRNNFNLIRMVAAYSVLVSHSFALAPHRGTEPLQHLFGASLGGLAVMLFFVISGFFIALSLERRTSLADFCIARVFRIWPALIVVLCASALILGPLVTDVPLRDYFTRKAVAGYVARNITLFWGRSELPGVFADNHYPDAVNGSLWSLSYEVGCYAMLAAIVVMLPRGRRGMVACAIALVVTIGLWPVGAAFASVQDRVILSFALGAIACQLRHYIPLRWDVVALLALAAAALRWTPLWFPALMLALGYAVMVMGAVRSSALQSYNRVGDLSYGTYLYAFPIQQGFAAMVPQGSPIAMIAATTPVVLGAAWLSWTFVEEPCLKRRHAVVGLLRRRVARPA